MRIRTAFTDLTFELESTLQKETSEDEMDVTLAPVVMLNVSRFNVVVRM